MTLPIQDVFRFWEADLTGVQAPQPATGGALALAMELQTADWTEEEAGAELARRCDSRSLHTAQEVLLEAFQKSPALLIRAICASRALWVAIDLTDATPESVPSRRARRLWPLRRSPR
jgi:hypothetical protein